MINGCKYFNEHLKTIREYIGCLYRIEGCETGGLLHILLDDDNIDDNSIRFCLRECEAHPEQEESEIGKLICNEYLKLTIEQRRLLTLTGMHFIGCKYNCDSCYIKVGDENDRNCVF